MSCVYSGLLWPCVRRVPRHVSLLNKDLRKATNGRPDRCRLPEASEKRSFSSSAFLSSCIVVVVRCHVCWGSPGLLCITLFSTPHPLLLLLLWDGSWQGECDRQESGLECQSSQRQPETPARNNIQAILSVWPVKSGFLSLRLVVEEPWLSAVSTGHLKAVSFHTFWHQFSTT